MSDQPVVISDAEALTGEFRVVGIDPAPSSDSVLCFYDGEELVFKSLTANKVLHFLQTCEGQGSVLITWDAPLTGPALFSTSDDRKYARGDFTQRDVEKFFMRKEYGHKPPSGINTQGYSGCQHWTITKALTGLPLLGPYCQRDDLPFHHIVSEEKKLRKDKPNIVEVHPALAIYLWIEYFSTPFKVKNWNYKKEDDLRTTLLRHLRNGPLENISKKLDEDKIYSDDHLDAFVAWALGYYLANQVTTDPKVKVMGDQKRGSMLLPYIPEVFKAFEKHFPKSEKKKT